MKPTEFRVKNLGPIKSMAGRFPDAGVVYVTGDNGRGKSSFIHGFLDMLNAGSNEGKMMRGERSGVFEQTFVAPNGDEYIARFDLDPTTSNRLTVVSPEGKTVKKIGDIKELLDYPDFTVEEYIRWGETAEGRRMQGDVVFKMLTEEEQILYANLAMDEKKLFEDRAFKNRLMKDKRGALKVAEPSNEELQEAMLYVDYQSKEEAIVDGMSGYEEVNTRAQELSNQLSEAQMSLNGKRGRLDDKRRSYADLDAEVKELEKHLEKKKMQRAAVKQEGEQLASEAEKESARIKDLEGELADANQLKERFGSKEAELDTIRQKMGECLDIKLRVEAFESLEQEVYELEREWKALDANIASTRIAKREVLEKANLPVDDLVLEDGELFVQKEGQLFKFSEKEMCTSELLVKGIEIVLAANPKTKVVFLFNANLLNSAKREELDQLAKHMDYLFLLELVDERHQDVQLIAHEEYV